MYTAIIVFSSCIIFGVCKKGAGDSKSPRSPPPFQFLPGSTFEFSQVPNGFMSIRTSCNQIKQLRAENFSNQANLIITCVCYLHHSSVSILKVATESRDIKLTNKKSNSNTTEHMLQIYCTLTFSTL